MNEGTKTVKSSLVNWIVFAVILIIALIGAEYIYRKMLFSDNEAFKHLKNPGYYADSESEDDYWKLYYLLDGNFKPPVNPHAVLGWVGNFWWESYMHKDVLNTRKKRPVLLYGDSFAQTVRPSRSFQEILNSDTLFNKNHHILNYGVGGYGVDQISILFEKSAKYYDRPFIVFSLLTTDLDRSILKVRTGQKPYYEINNDSLVLKGFPINPDPDQFFKENPVEIKSFLFRRFLYSNVNFLPNGVDAWLKNEFQYIEKKKKINKRIIEKVISKLKSMDADFVFLVFHPIIHGQNSLEENSDWRNSFIRNLLEENKVPYIWSLDLIKQDQTFKEKKVDNYMLPGDGHPNTHLNTLIANEMKKHVLQSWSGEQLKEGDRVGYYINQIKEYEPWLTSVRSKALERNIPLDTMILMDARYMAGLDKKKGIYSGLSYLEKIDQVTGQIKNNPKWLENTKKAALKKSIPLDSMILLNARYTVGSTSMEE